MPLLGPLFCLVFRLFLQGVEGMQYEALLLKKRTWCCNMFPVLYPCKILSFDLNFNLIPDVKFLDLLKSMTYLCLMNLT